MCGSGLIGSSSAQRLRAFLATAKHPRPPCFALSECCSEECGNLIIAEAMEKAGKDDVITVEEAHGMETA